MCVCYIDITANDEREGVRKKDCCRDIVDMETASLFTNSTGRTREKVRNLINQFLKIRCHEIRFSWDRWID